MWLFAEKESYIENTLEKGLHLQDKHSMLIHKFAYENIGR